MRRQALELLRRSLGNVDAQFRDGQWEAISALAERRARLLIVQRTGWGKSLVYFIATKLLRDQGGGCTLLVSPLLSLMRNQIAAARNIGVRAETINSSNVEDWPRIEAGLHRNEFDVLLISPERLANDEFVNRCLLPIANRVGLFVVDEAHFCLAQETDRVVQLEYVPGPLEADGTIRNYSLEARAGNYGYRSFYVDITGVVRATKENRDATSADPPIH